MRHYGPDRRYTLKGCGCGDAWCAGCADADVIDDRAMREHARRMESARERRAARKESR
jgi:hypothetical protein